MAATEESSVPVDFEVEMAAVENSSSFDFDVEISEEEGKEDSSSSGGNLFSSSGVTGITDRNLPRDNPIHAETSTSGKSNSSSSQLTNTETLRKKKRYSQFLRTFMDGKVPIRKMVKISMINGLSHQAAVLSLVKNEEIKGRKEKKNRKAVELEKLERKLLREVATVKDGTVRFEVPEDIKSQSLDFGAGGAYNDDIIEEHVDAIDNHVPPLQIVMLIVGTRGDVQPFVAIGKGLQACGHRVRLATHSNFKEFVLNAGLEFFQLGGDPKVLAGYMVKNKGFLPSDPSEIPIQRGQIKEIVCSLLPACVEDDPISKVSFEPDAIISNPPAYGHMHVAEALKVPIHIFFTMPWTPTSEFPHPLSRIKQPIGYRISYQIVDAMIWLGIRDIINDFRKKKLKLRPVTYLKGSYSSPHDVPYGYLWSPHLVPKPKDWGHNIDVVGFCFLDLASNYVPPESLVEWLDLDNKPRPIYIGFGSLPLPEPKKMTNVIVQALHKTGQRGIINKGWGGLGDLDGLDLDLSEQQLKGLVYVLDNCPHDWLFLQCSAVVHHGGAGTTAAGLRAACPTTIVPFFGDQPFWGERVHARGVGPAPIPVDEFGLEKLVDAIHFMLDTEVKDRASKLAEAMKDEDGVTGAVNAFHKHFPREKPENEVATPSGLCSITQCFRGF
ncbi:sterol 3-beta-glucosyltransferase UGT80A2-like isoform X2 [Vitis riparia]|uniref:sterol 3-beta-glucosyltransferase UGT80A2-like isoform X2 n=1 Tax=Vitis riparia TaxID=96939 RepID=UPI00155A0800|nr:sterol 3-beta-glucosyltransferase UGT80A2-like isoform X2 [Vitis riparia]